MNLKAFPFDDIYALIDDKVEKLVLIITKINSQKF